MQDEDAIRTQIKIACTAKGYTRYKLAKECEMPYSSVCRFWEGNAALTIYMLESFCKVLNIPVSAFFEATLEDEDLLSLKEWELIRHLRNMNMGMQAIIYKFIEDNTLGDISKALSA